MAKLMSPPPSLVALAACPAGALRLSGLPAETAEAIGRHMIQDAALRETLAKIGRPLIGRGSDNVDQQGDRSTCAENNRVDACDEAVPQ